jgi:hypothetical protein
MSSAIRFDYILYYSTWAIQNLIEMTQLVFTRPRSAFRGLLLLVAIRPWQRPRWSNVLATSNVEYAVSSAPEAIMLYLLGSTHSLEPRSKVLQRPPDLSAVLFR